MSDEIGAVDDADADLGPDEASGSVVPTGRVRRMASLGRLAGAAAAREGAVRVANVARSDEKAQAAIQRQQIKTAQQMVDVLGTMKGAAMKVGQALSVLDVGLVPEDYREEFQEKLAELRNMAPTVSFREMKAVMEKDLGDKLDNLFYDFEKEPVGAASIGQVYRARLKDKPRGWETDEVAIKVQYPGISAAVRADLKNLNIILRLAKTMAPGIDVQAVGKEITERMVEELDYELEASNQRTMARRYRGHPFIYIPQVASDLCGERVIVTEFIHGESFDSWKDKEDAERSRLCEIIFSFYYGSLWRDGQFSADPHPGNSILMPDGRVAFLDFGLFHSVPREIVENQAEMLRLGMARDGEGLANQLVKIEWFPEHAKPDANLALELFDMSSWWATQDAVVRLNPHMATKIAFEATNPMGKEFGTLRQATVPPVYLMGLRLAGMTLGVCSLLDAELNYFKIADHWLRDAPPPSELAIAEDTWLKKRGGKSW